VEQEQLSQRVESFRSRVAALQQRRGEAPAQDGSVLAAALQELDAAYEELRAAQEALSRQAAALAQAEQALQAERRRYRDLFEAAPDGYLVTDTGGIILDANGAATTLLNSLQQFLVGKPLAAFIAPEEALAFRFRLLHLAQIDRAGEWEVRLHPIQRPPFTAVVTVGVVRDAEGRPTALRWLVRDVGERRRIEQALREKEQQIAASRLEGVGLAARELAHLLHNDVGLIVGALERLRHQRDLPDDLRALAGPAQAALDRTMAHVAQMQQVVRVETKDTSLGPALDLERSL